MVDSIDPVLTGIDRNEYISDPFVREAYFGSPDTPGIISQATTAANRAYGRPFRAKGVAGFSPFANRAMEGAYSGIGGYKPYLGAYEGALRQGMDTIGQRKGLLNEALGATRRSGQIQQPYFAQAERQLQGGMQDLTSSYGRQGPSARDFQRASLQGFDPRSTQAFYNPFEEQVVQRTIDDVFKQGEIADIGQRARDISSGGESAFGSRARLGAEERRAALGRGLGEALAGIRSGGFDTAQGRAMDESRFGRGQLGDAARFESGLGQSMLDARRGYSGDLLGIGGQRGNLARNISGDIRGISGDIGGIGQDIADYGRAYGDLGQEYQRLGQGERSELMQYDQASRDMKQAGIDAQYTADERNRFAPTQAASYVQGFLPQYTSGSTRVNKTYGMPIDPYSQGIGTFLSAYGAMNPNSTAGAAAGATGGGYT
jgi:hypothetical protein